LAIVAGMKNGMTTQNRQKSNTEKKLFMTHHSILYAYCCICII